MNHRQSDASDSDNSESDSDDSESGSDAESAEEKTEVPSKKRKADDEAEATSKKTKTSEDESAESATLFVGNLSWKVDDNLLYEEFEHCKGVTGARIMTNRDDGRPRGFGYVDFDTAENAKAALEEKQSGFLDGRDMRIDLSTGKPNKNPNDRANDRAKKFNDEMSPESDTLFVGNLSFQVDEESVSAFFSDVANVKSLRLPTEQYVIDSF